jgi:hypothetical protein
LINIGNDTLDRPGVGEVWNLFSQIRQRSEQPPAFLGRNTEVPDHPSIDPDIVQDFDPSAQDCILPAAILLDERDRGIELLEKQRTLHPRPQVPLVNLSAIERNHAVVEPALREIVHDDPCLPLERLPGAEITNQLLGRLEESDRREADITRQL